MLEYIKTCPMNEVYPETAKAFNLHDTYHHFKKGDSTYSFPLKGTEFETPAMCMSYYYKHMAVKEAN